MLWRDLSVILHQSLSWAKNSAILTAVPCQLCSKWMQNLTAKKTLLHCTPGQLLSQRTRSQPLWMQVRGMKSRRNPHTESQQEEWRKRNKTVLTYITAAGMGMIGISYAAVAPGKTALAFYKAKNPTDKPVIGISTYNVVPFEAGQYFNKMQCFCFAEQRLNPNEEVDMPVFFYIDPEFDEDPRIARVDTITLSYTFFEAKEGQKLPLPGYS
ncbi:COX11 protein, partial [Polyodon spathula]|nr:COX11 protein [Polyodon spathula]